MKKLKFQEHKEKAKIIILSVILAVVAWVAIVWVDNPVTTTTLSGIDIRFIGEKELRDRGLVIIGKKNIPEMSASVSGTRNDLMQYMDHVYMEADASEITEAGEYELPVTVSLPSSHLTLKKQKTENVPVTIEKLAEKEIDVRVKQTGTLKDRTVKSEIEDDRVVVSGAKSELENIEYALAAVDISKITEDCTVQTGYILMGTGDSPITKNESIETKRAAIDVKNTVYKLKTLPVDVEFSKELESKYAFASAPSVLPEGIDAGVSDGNTDFSVKAVITAVSDDGDIEFEFEETEGIYIPESSKNIKIKADIEKKISRELELDVGAENPPLTAQHIDKVRATVSGAESKLNTDNIKATVDLAGLNTGTYSLPVKIEGEGITVDAQYYTNVTIE